MADWSLFSERKQCGLPIKRVVFRAIKFQLKLPTVRTKVLHPLEWAEWLEGKRKRHNYISKQTTVLQEPGPSEQCATI